MFERFTPAARRVVVLAQDEARLLDHHYIGTEHLLLGLLRERDGVAARAIESAGLSLEAARAQVVSLIGRGAPSSPGPMPFTPRAKRILELSLSEALIGKKPYIGTEHILLSLIREEDGVGALILQQLCRPEPALADTVIELAAAEPEPGPGRDPGAGEGTAPAAR